MSFYDRRLRPSTSIPHRIVGAVIGAVCFTCAMALLTDGSHPGSWSLDHWLTAAVLLIATAAGELWLTAIKDRRLINGFAWLMVMLCALVAILPMSSGLRAKSTGEQAVAAEASNADRKRWTQKLAEAEEILAQHRRSQAVECTSGKGKKCDGISYTVDTWKAVVYGYETKLAGTPPKSVSPRAEQVAEAWVTWLGGDKARIKHRYTITEPYLFPILFDFGSIVAFNYATGARRRRRVSGNEAVPKQAPAISPVVPSSPASPVSRVSSLGRGNGQQKQPETSETSETRRPSNVEVVPDEDTIVVGLRLVGGTSNSDRQLAQAMKISPAEASKRLSACGNSGKFRRRRVDNRIVTQLVE